MPTDTVLSDEKLIDLELRPSHFSRIDNRHEVGVTPEERDALCATVRVLREDLKYRCEALEELRRCRDRWLTMLNPATAEMSVDAAITALREQLAQAETARDQLSNALSVRDAQLAEAKKWQFSVEEREAAVCPEDVGFDEYIRHLEKKLAQVTAERDELQQRIASDSRFDSAVNVISDSVLKPEVREAIERLKQ